MIYTDEQREFLESHRWAVLATGRQDGSPQQSMVGYTIDGEGRILISSQTFTAKVRNTRRLPRVSLTVPDGRVHVAVYGTAEIIENDPERAELSADVLAVVRGPDRPDPAAIVQWLDQQQRIVVRITPERVFSHE